MMDCKNALKDTAGDIEAAVDFLRKKGLAGAEKKAGRSTTEGLIGSYIHAGSGCSLLLYNHQFVNSTATYSLAMHLHSSNQIITSSQRQPSGRGRDTSCNVALHLSSLSLKGGYWCSLGVLLEVNCETDFVARGEVFKSLCSDLAMQIAAFGDVVAVSANDIPQDLVDKEREIEMGKEDILSKPEDKRCAQTQAFKLAHDLQASIILPTCTQQEVVVANA